MTIVVSLREKNFSLIHIMFYGTFYYKQFQQNKAQWIILIKNTFYWFQLIFFILTKHDTIKRQKQKNIHKYCPNTFLREILSVISNVSFMILIFLLFRGEIITMTFCKYILNNKRYKEDKNKSTYRNFSYFIDSYLVKLFTLQKKKIITLSKGTDKK